MHDIKTKLFCIVFGLIFGCLFTLLAQHAKHQLTTNTPVVETTQEEIDPDYFSVISDKSVSGTFRIIVVEDKQNLTRYAVVWCNNHVAITQLKEKCW